VVTVSGLTSFGGGATTTGEAGGWIIEGLEQGEYRVELKDTLGKILTCQQVLVDSDTRLDLELPQASISGMVLTADSRVPVAGALVQARGHGYPGIERKTSTDDSGSFVLEDLPDSTYSITAEKPDHGSAHEVAEVAGGLSQDLTLLLEGESTLVLRVQNPDGTPPDKIYIEMLHSGLTSGFQVHCEAAGRCPISNMPAGPATLLVVAGDSMALLAATRSEGEVPVSLRPRVALKISAAPGPSGGVWQVRIIEAATGLVVPYWHYIRRGGGEWITVGGEDLGHIIPAGTYLIEGASPSGEIKQQQVVAEAGKEVEVSFR
jgi:hypothetical protein